MLYVVPTPIGNLKDFTLRAIEILKECDGVIAEDTRKTAQLLSHYSIQKPVSSFHTANEHKVVERIVKRMEAGESLALVTDAGTPGISDPGYLLVRHCIDSGIEVNCLPGPVAFVPALVMSGIGCERFVFEGFLPHKKGRQTRLASLAEENRTMVFYEAPHRILKSLNEFIGTFGAERKASISRELTKMYEQTLRGSLAELHQHFTEHNPKGEFVIVVDGFKK
jgi:16S rRNA (cytidine1402-2'-O)-methyltransferase